MANIVNRYGFADMVPNEKTRIELDSMTSRGELRSSAMRFAKKNGYTVQLDKGERPGVLYLTFLKPRESLLLSR